MSEIHNRQTKMSITEKEYGNFYDKAFKKDSRKKSCNGCNYQTMSINPTCARCNDRELYEKSIGSCFADDINVAESD